MVWYQMFEYAIGHWLQKSTEHVMGCVLCSPGCFSLFRGQALMDTNVMRKYNKDSEKPLDFVQASDFSLALVKIGFYFLFFSTIKERTVGFALFYFNEVGGSSTQRHRMPTQVTT